MSQNGPFGKKTGQMTHNELNEHNGFYGDHLKSLNRPMMRFNDLNDFADLYDLDDYLNDLNRHK